MPYKPDGSPPPRGRCPKDREGLLIVHPHGSVDCSGNYELHEIGQLTVDN